MSGFETEQERFWAGESGDDYVDRSQGAHLIASRTAMWSRILRSCGSIGSVTEFGANIGLNLRALRNLLPGAELTGVEINAKAAQILGSEGTIKVLEGSLFDTAPSAPADLAFTCSVLIHINPARLPIAYDQLARGSRRYIVMSEYYNPAPTEVTYRGHSERLYKRDFAGEFLDSHPEFELRDYGFVYHRDAHFPADDFTWFLMERR
jgi:spore coat polysaccharide biosynthesis protein SpsF